MAEATTYSNEMNVDKILEVLSNERRRTILAYLLEENTPVTVEELIDHVVSAEVDEQTRRESLRNEIRVSLHHVHLPKLADANVIDVNFERGLITELEAAYALEPYLELTMEDDRRS